jgi:hypothetical protein
VVFQLRPGLLALGGLQSLWTDPSRIEPLAPNRSPRELMVDIWYPADSQTGAAAEYLNVTAFERALGAEGLRKQFSGAYDAIKANCANPRSCRRTFCTFDKAESRPDLLSGRGDDQRSLRGSVGRTRLATATSWLRSPTPATR